MTRMGYQPVPDGHGLGQRRFRANHDYVSSVIRAAADVKGWRHGDLDAAMWEAAGVPRRGQRPSQRSCDLRSEGDAEGMDSSTSSPLSTSTR